MLRQGLILFAHGARDGAWAAPFEAVAVKVRGLRPDLSVRLAYLEFMTPTLAQAAAELAAAGCPHIDVLPMFLGTGGHVRRDLPNLLAELRTTHAGTRIELHASVGELPAVSAAMAGAIATLLPRRP